MLKRIWCLWRHRAAWKRHHLLRGLAICARCGEVHEVPYIVPAMDGEQKP